MTADVLSHSRNRLQYAQILIRTKSAQSSHIAIKATFVFQTVEGRYWGLREWTSLVHSCATAQWTLISFSRFPRSRSTMYRLHSRFMHVFGKMKTLQFHLCVAMIITSSSTTPTSIYKQVSIYKLRLLLLSQVEKYLKTNGNSTSLPEPAAQSSALDRVSWWCEALTAGLTCIFHHLITKVPLVRLFSRTQYVQL